MHYLEHIGVGNNIYVVGYDGNTASNADTQRLNVGDVIDVANLGGRNLAEQTESLKLYKTTNHQYYKWDYDNNQAVQDSGVVAENMPDYLTGWITSNNDPGPIGELTQTILNKYFDGTNLNLYGTWDNTCLIRVIPFISKNSTTQDLMFDVSLTANTSYTSGDYKLNGNYKTITDNAVNTFMTDTSGTRIPEYGRGYGCYNNGSASYFGVKIGDTVSFAMVFADRYLNYYIPYYTIDRDTPVYHCYIADYLVRREGWINGEQDLTYASDVWSMNISNVTTDKTIFIPLVEKPYIQTSVNPSGGGTTTGGGRKMPGDTCTVVATANNGYTFSRWENSIGTQLSQSSSYTFNVTGSENLVAVFNQQLGNVFTFSWLLQEGLYGDISYLVTITIDDNAPQQVSNNPTTYSVNNQTIITISMRDGGNSFNFIRTVQTYTGSTRDPLNDRGLGMTGTLPNGISYGFFNGIHDPSTGNETILRLDFSNMVPNTNFQAYVYYHY